MRHTRFELGFPRNRKVSRLSDAAFRLWSSSIDHAREQRTNGAIEKADLAIIPRGGGQIGWKPAVVKELVEAGLWHQTDDGWEIHDFLDWQDSATEVDRAREQARERMRRVRSNPAPSGSGSVRANNDRTSGEVTPTYSDSDSNSDPGSDPATTGTTLPVTARGGELQAKAAAWVRDRNGASLNHPNPEKWSETRHLVAVLAEVFGGPEQQPRHAGDPRAEVLLARWAEGRTTDELEQAIRGAGLDDQIRSKPQLQTLTTILRDSGQVDRYSRLLTVPALPPAPGTRAPTGRAGDALERQRERSALARAQEAKALP